MKRLKLLALVSLAFLCMNSELTFAADEIPKDSLYRLPEQWFDSNASQIKLSHLKGTPTLITMVYLSCPHACPLMFAKLKEIEKKLKEKGLSQYKFVIASFDPEKDKPEKLKKYMTEKNLSAEHWTLLTAKDDGPVRALSLVLGINYKKLDNGDFSHSNIVALLDKNGRIVDQIDRLSAEDDHLIQSLEKLVETK